MIRVRLNVYHVIRVRLTVYHVIRVRLTVYHVMRVRLTVYYRRSAGQTGQTVQTGQTTAEADGPRVGGVTCNCVVQTVGGADMSGNYYKSSRHLPMN